MGLISMVVDGFRGGPRAEGNPLDERYWSSGWSDFATALGIHMTPKDALQASCVFAGVRLIAETAGMLPLKVVRKVDARTREPIDDHPILDLLAVDGQPNVFQTGQELRETLTAHMVLWGKAFAERIEGRGGYPEQLIPLDPDRVTVEQLPSYRLRYKVREKDGSERTLLQEQVFRLRGLGITNGVLGENVMRLAREAIGLWLAMEKYAALFFGQGAKPGMFFQHPQAISEPAYKRLRESIDQTMSGLYKMHRPQILEEGMKVEAVGYSAEQAQMVESREAQVREVARWLNVPEHMLRSGKQPTFASVEQFAREFIDYSLQPWLTRWESSVGVWLVVEPDIKVKHNVNALLRGHAKDRAEANTKLVQAGIKTRNEARAEEDLNPLDGLDEPLTPLNMERGTTADEEEAEPSPAPRRADAVDGEAKITVESIRQMFAAADPARAGMWLARSPEEASRLRAATAMLSSQRRLRLIAEEAARGVVRKELAAVEDKAVKMAGRAGAWRSWLAEFYDQHAALVAERLQLEPAVAKAYCDRHRDALLAGGVAVLETWQTAAAAELVGLALEETVDA